MSQHLSIPLQAGAFVRTAAGRAAAETVARLRENGFAAWLAGGCVRDVLLGESPTDFDVATSATPDQIRPLFARVVDTGVRYGTVTILAEGCETQVTTFRAEGGYADGRHPTALVFGVSAEEDALRRDFTINALFGDPFRNVVIDYVGGAEDLRARRIRAVGDAGLRFDEDALRLLRFVRFAGRLGACADPATARAARSRPHLLRKLSRERVAAELTKMLEGPRPALTLQLLENYGFLEEVLPEVAAMRGVPQPPQFHPEGDVFVHTLGVIEQLERKSLILTLAALFHDAGKPRTLSLSDRIRFHGHEPESCQLALARMRKLRLSNLVIDGVLDLIAEHIRIGTLRAWRRGKKLRFLMKENIDDHLALHYADCSASHGLLDNYHYACEELSKLRASPPVPPLLRGDDLLSLGILPGPIYKKILNDIREAQLEGSLTSRDAAIAYVRKKFPVATDPPAS